MVKIGIAKRIKMASKGKKKHPGKAEIGRLSSHYRKDVMSNETLELLPKEEFSNLQPYPTL